MEKLYQTLVRALSFCVTFFVVYACEPATEPVRIGKDACAFCKMTILDPRFAAEAVTKKGKVFKFDDLLCASEYCKMAELDSSKLFGIFVSSFQPAHDFLPVLSSILLKSEGIRSPMGGNVAAFPEKDSSLVRTLFPDARQVSWPASISK